jgi:hypothetical protein
MMSSNKEKSTDDVMKKLKKERPDCSYLINSYCVFENNGVNQKSEKIKRIMRQCPEDDGMVRLSLSLFQINKNKQLGNRSRFTEKAW